jgi:mRNA interferase RelE/StbE
VTTPPEGYSVEWSNPGKCAIERLPEEVALAAIEFIYGPLTEMPHRVGNPLRLEFEGLHSARRGDHRIVYRIDEPDAE